MSNYWKIQRASSDCVHFVYADQIDDSDAPIAEELKRADVRYVYVDYLEVRRESDPYIGNAIAQALKLEHAPYRPRTSPHQSERWVPFLDDLITLSHHANGIAIIIDNADDLLAENSREMFGLIEAFLIQFHHWFEKQKPCHLCFQMEKSEWVKRFFASS
jgi:hypothetical protein